MYRKKTKGWYKHKDFIFLDLCCIVLAFLLADWIRCGTISNIYENKVYRNTAIFILLMDLGVSVLFELYKGVLRRGYYQEFLVCLKHMFIIELAAGLYLFSVDDGHSFSRIVLYLMGIFYMVALCGMGKRLFNADTRNERIGISILMIILHLTEGLWSLPLFWVLLFELRERTKT